MPIVDLKHMYNSVKQFYDSKVPFATIEVHLNEPINDKIIYNINRGSDIQTTLNDIISKVKVSLSSYMKINYKNGKHDITNNIKTKNNYVSGYFNDDYNKYLVNNFLA